MSIVNVLRCPFCTRNYLEKSLEMVREMNQIWTSRLEEFGLSALGLRVEYPTLEYFIIVEDFVAEAEILTGIGQIYLDLGYKKLAEQYFLQAFLISQKAYKAADNWNANYSGFVIPTVTYTEGLVKFVTGDHDRAKELFEEVLNSSSYLGPFQITKWALVYAVDFLLSEQVLPGWAKSTTLFELGKLYYQDGDWGQAEYYLTRLISEGFQYAPYFATTGDFRYYVSFPQSLNLLGYTYLQKGQLVIAASVFQKALTFAISVEDLNGQLNSIIGLSYVFARTGDDKLALTYVLEAIDLQERLGNQYGIEFINNAFQTNADSLYILATRLLVEQNRYKEAFEISERGRARVFLDSLGGEADNTNYIEESELIQKQAVQDRLVLLSQELTKLLSHPDSKNSNEIQRLKNELLQAQVDYENLLVKLAAAGMPAQPLIGVNPIGVDELRSKLGKNTTLISYYLMDEKIGAFIISRDHFSYQTLPITVTEIQNVLRNLRINFVSPELNNESARQFEKLYGSLISPLRASLKTNIVGIIPNGELHYVPFSALKNDQKYLVDEFQLFELPSASVYPLLADKSQKFQSSEIVETSNEELPYYRPPETLISFGFNSPEGYSILNYAEKEAEWAASIFQGDAYLGENATESNFRQYSGTADILLIAAHAELNPRNYKFSKILLAGNGRTLATDGSLNLFEISSLDLIKSRIVILSGCDTGQGFMARGDDLISLNRAFLSAGAGNVIATLWKVDDQASSILVLQFLEYLKLGYSPAASLRFAQIKVREQFPNPYYWGAFTLVGDGGDHIISSRELLNLEYKEDSDYILRIADIFDWLILSISALAFTFLLSKSSKLVYLKVQEKQQEIHALEFINDGQLDKGEDILNKLLSSKTHRGIVWRLLGQIALSRKQIRHAKACFKLAKRLDDVDPL